MTLLTFYRVMTSLTLLAALVALLGIMWAPGAWWKLLIVAAVLAIAAAAFSNGGDAQEQRRDERGRIL